MLCIQHIQNAESMSGTRTRPRRRTNVHDANHPSPRSEDGNRRLVPLPSLDNLLNEVYRLDDQSPWRDSVTRQPLSDVANDMFLDIQRQTAPPNTRPSNNHEDGNGGSLVSDGGISSFTSLFFSGNPTEGWLGGPRSHHGVSPYPSIRSAGGSAGEIADRQLLLDEPTKARPTDGSRYYAEGAVAGRTVCLMACFWAVIGVIAGLLVIGADGTTSTINSRILPRRASAVGVALGNGKLSVSV